MLLLSMKLCLALASVLLAMGSASDSISATSNISSTVELNKTTTQLVGAQNETDAHSSMWSPTYRPADVSATAPGVETEEATIAYGSGSSKHNSTGSMAINTVATAASSSGQPLLRTSTGATTAAGEAEALHITATTGPAKPLEEQLREQTATTDGSVTYSTASPAADTVSLPQPASTTKPEVASNFFNTSSTADSTQTAVVNQSPNSPAAPVPSTKTGNPSSKGAPYSPVTTGGTSTNGTELSSTFQPSAPGGSKLLIPTTKSTTMPREAAESTASTDCQPCSSRAMAKRCLIVIASLAGLATVFMVSTIILCAKLSTRKYKVKKPQQATEMMSVSTLLPEIRFSYLRRHSPVSNGILVMPYSGDSDEDGGDNLTLSSFLPENDRLV